MTRSRYRRCRVCGDYHWESQWPANHVEPEVERSALPAPMLNRDGIDALWHPHDGRLYESKSEFRAVTKASGGEEVGTEVQVDKRANERVSKADVGEAIQKVAQGYKPAVHSTSAGTGWQ